LKTKKLIFLKLIFYLSLFCFYPYGFAENTPVHIPALLPDIAFENSLSKEELQYLGIQRDSRFFSINDINGIFILVELTNTYCVSCQKNIKIFNKVYKKTLNNKELREKIKIISIAIGNNKQEVDCFKNEHNILYPIITDPEFTAHKALGEPRVPYTMYVRRDAEGKLLIFKTHKSVFDSSDILMNEIRLICSEYFNCYSF